MIKRIVGFENYSVSDDGHIYNTKFNRETKRSKNSIGYLRVLLSNKGQKKQVLVHRLVAQAFVPNPYNKPEVNHIDGNKENNCAQNLEWVTRSENESHSYKNGLQFQKIKREQASVIRFLYSLGGITQRDISKIYNVRPQSINYIINKWKV